MTGWIERVAVAAALSASIGLGIGTPDAASLDRAPAASRSPEEAAIRGAASWYAYVPGHAAAGPALRRALGDWRGQVVRVCHEGRCVRVRLTDWCQCYKGTARERVIDLDVRSFAALASPRLGVLRVVVRP